MLKTDIIKVISNYMEIDTDELDIQITQTQSEDNNGTVPVLYANIPIKSMQDESRGLKPLLKDQHKRPSNAGKPLKVFFGFLYHTKPFAGMIDKIRKIIKNTGSFYIWTSKNIFKIWIGGLWGRFVCFPVRLNLHCERNAYQSGESPANVIKQGVFFLIGIALMVIAANADYEYISQFTIPLYIVNILLLVTVLLVGSESKGATRWIALWASDHSAPRNSPR